MERNGKLGETVGRDQNRDLGGAFPYSRRRCRPLSGAMHSEHDLKERQRRTNHSESFPLWGHNPSTQPAAPAAPLFFT